MLAVVTNQPVDRHDAPAGHPERAARSRATLQGIAAAGIDDALLDIAPRAATVDELALVHDRDYLASMAALCEAGGGRLDADTYVAPGSWETATLAAGAGIVACETLAAGEADAAFVVARPPGHHASAARPMGFCIVNSVGVAAGWLASRGERVLIVDWDVHHGNGTQEVFWDDPDVLFFSLHEEGIYPWSGSHMETGGANAPGTTINVPLPAGSTGDAMRAALDDVLIPAAEAFGPTWVLVSAGFDAHRYDGLARLRFSATDFADAAERVARLAPSPGRLALFLEGGYDLECLRLSMGAAAAAAVGERFRPEPVSSGDTGVDQVRAVTGWRRRQGLLPD
jgi:acetoin utilization deacetylase AcuC-like enzyme